VTNAMTPTVTAVTTAPAPKTRGITAGDSDIMPPRFDGSRGMDAPDWVQDFADYMSLHELNEPDALILLRTRLIGPARTWLKTTAVWHRQPLDGVLEATSKALTSGQAPTSRRRPASRDGSVLTAAA